MLEGGLKHRDHAETVLDDAKETELAKDMT